MARKGHSPYRSASLNPAACLLDIQRNEEDKKTKKSGNVTRQSDGFHEKFRPRSSSFIRLSIHEQDFKVRSDSNRKDARQQLCRFPLFSFKMSKEWRKIFVSGSKRKLAWQPELCTSVRSCNIWHY